MHLVGIYILRNMKYVRFPWPPVEAALSIFTVSFLVKDFLRRMQ